MKLFFHVFVNIKNELQDMFCLNVFDCFYTVSRGWRASHNMQKINK